jgi:para-nitrobenzyl esterase
MQVLFSLLMALMSVTLVVASPPPTLETVITLSAGPITGLQFSPTLYKFLGIPYAKAPTGNGRFASPVAYPAASLLKPFVLGHHHSNPSINATAFGNICPQSTGGAEDCLFLNVFTTSVSPLALRPVMFW